MNWRNTGRAVGIVLSGFIIFLLSLIIIVTLLLFTERGTRVSLSLAERFAPGELMIEHRQGYLMGELKLAKVIFRDETLDLVLDDLVLDWRPRQLFANKLLIKNVQFSALAIHIEPGESQEPDDPAAEFELPDINLPFDILLERAHLNSIDIQIGDFSQHIERIELIAESRGSEQAIEHFLVRIEEGEVTASGVVETQGDYPLDLRVGASLSLPDLHQLNAQVEIQGSLADLNLSIVSDGLVDAHMNARVQDPLDIESLIWQAQLKLDAVRHEALFEHIRALSVAVHGEGTANDFSVHLDGEIESIEYGPVDLSGHLAWQDMQLVIHELEANFEDQPAYLDVSGTAAFGEDLDIDIRGYADVLGFTVSEFSLVATGNEQGAHQLTLSLDVPQGQADISGSVLWEPHLSWDLSVQLRDVNLEDINENIEGELALQLLTEGQFSDELVAYANIEQLTGNIFGQVIDGSGEVRISGETITANQLDILWGEAQVQAHGEYSPQTLDLTWLVNVPDLATLLPNAEGRINSQGQVAGSQEQPTLQVELSIEDFRWDIYELDETIVNLEIDGTLGTLPVGDIRVRNLIIEDQLIERVDVRLRAGEQHNVEADIDYGDLQARLALRGVWDFEQLAWQGELHRLQLRYPDIGRWNLSNPASVQASPQQARVDDFCLIISTRESQICADGHWTAESGDIQLALRAEDVPYQLFSPWIPDDVQLMGEFSLIADIEQVADQLSADVRLNITDSSVRVPAQELRVDFDGGEILRIQGDQQELVMQLRVLSEQLEGGIEANAILNDVLSDDRRVDGELGVDIRSFVLISVLMPDLQNVTGHLNGRIDFAGELDDLVIGGGLELREGGAEIPATGLELRNLNLTLTAPVTNEAPFILEGAVDAGEGQLSIDGEYYLREQRAVLALQGAAFPALNTRDLQVTIAPDLQIEYTPELLTLRGEVEVPRARITPPDFETVDTVSSDTVLIGGDGGPYDQSLGALPIDMDVVVRLGDDVQVDAYGFEGRLQGELRIIEQSGQETVAVGNIDVASGAYEIYGQALNIERGRLIFTGGPVANPGLDLRVERNIEAQSVTVGARVGGTLENPTLNLFSTPTMEDSAILSYLIFGRGPGQGSSGEENMLARATLALGMSGGNRLGERLSDTFGVDEITLDSGDTFESTALYIGKQLSSRLYIKYGVGLVEPVSTFFIQYRLTDNLNFESRTGNEQSGADLFYTIER